MAPSVGVFAFLQLSANCLHCSQFPGLASVWTGVGGLTTSASVSNCARATMPAMAQTKKPIRFTRCPLMADVDPKPE